jgi:GntR family transcriptional regulator
MRVQAYARVLELLKKRIIAGEFAKDGLLPPERAIEKQLGVSRITVRHAMRLLAEEGLVERRQGSGTYVRRVPERRIQIVAADFPGSMRRDAAGAVRQLIRRETTGLPADAAASLGLLAGERGLVAERLNSLGGEPLAFDRLYIPEALAGTVDEAMLARMDFLNAWMDSQNLALSHCAQTIEAAAADGRAAELLGIAPGAPVLRTIDVIHAADGRPVARFDSTFRGDRFRLVSTVKLDAVDAHGH